MRLLVVDDDAAIAKTVANLLTRQNHTVDVAMDGQIAWELARSQVYDLIVLDVMLPKLDGVSLCQKLRKEGYTAPILLLTARSSSDDKVTGLDAGADDYVIKPFDWQELLARIRALLRREGALVAPILSWGAISLNPQNFEVRYADKLLALRPREYKLLELLLRNPHRVFSCGAILEYLWTFEDQPSEDTVRSHIKGLRQKLKPVEAEDLIETVYGLGYRLRPVTGLSSGLSSKAATPSHTDISPADVSSHTVDELHQAIIAAWKEVKPQLLEQVKALESIAKIAKPGISERQRQGAIGAAHQLAGTVGAYGFKHGSEIARQIETSLQDCSFGSAQVATLKAQVGTLRQVLEADPEFDRSISLAPPLRLTNATSAKILAIDADPQVLMTLTSVLEPWGLNLTTLTEAQEFWEYLENVVPDLLLLDLAIHPSGLKICEQVRSHPRWAGLPILFLTAHTNAEVVRRVFQAGADDFVMKPIVAPELVSRVVTRIERYRFWQRLIERDPLTQLVNRVKFTQDFHRLLHSEPECFSLVILHLYQLKSLNHQQGYHTGDIALKQVATQLSRIREDHLVARWSGSKFAIGLPGTTSAQAVQHLSAVITHPQAVITPEGDGQSPVEDHRSPLAIRMGSAQYPKDGKDVQALYRSAEKNLAESWV